MTAGAPRSEPVESAGVAWNPWQWGLWQAPASFVALALSVGGFTFAWIILEAVRTDASRRSWLVLLVLLAVAVTFEEGATSIARLKWRLSSDLKRDMTSVWSVAAAVALPATPGVILVVVINAHLWWRQRRPSGQPVHRAVFTGATVVLACLTSGHVVRAIDSAAKGLPWALTGALVVVVAIVIGASINRVLITIGLVAFGRPVRSLQGSVDDNLTELSTLCLGGLVAVTAIHEPWLCALALLPLAMLQRGSFVREIESAAVTDPKTGLLNAVGWEHLAKRELARARRDNYDVSVLIIDIDHFKWVNDRHGHIVGDQVLREIARTFGSALREYDSVGRFGGEEFVAILPNAGDLTAVDVAERIRARVNTLTVASICPSDDEDLLSVSVGVATVQAADLGTADLTAMLSAADRALYRAKDSGRNRVCLADPDEPVALFERS